MQKSRSFTLPLSAALLLAVSLIPPGRAVADNVHKTYFENTDYELHVYEVHGYEPGPTMIIIGGIQGDEPGGYLSADLYADLSLQKGNLIVVPRANFYAILLNERGPNGDMNRKFTSERIADTETRIVEILKELIGRSDVLLNLHDGSGFYREKQIDDLHNPMRFGQSVIGDAESYTGPASGKVIPLGQIARRVCEAVNPHIPEQEYHFRFNNHNTVSKGTLHPEQRLSATYYSLTRHEIPAFGIESSKEIPDNETKVRHKSMVINAFMKEFGIVPENPKILVEKPQLNHLIVLINGKERVAVKDGESVLLAPGDEILIEHIDLNNYRRGLAADIIGQGGINDLGKPFRIDYPTRVVIRKDSFKCATVQLAVSDRLRTERQPRVAGLNTGPAKLELVTLLIDGQRREVADGDTLEVPRGTVLELVDAVTGQSAACAGELVVNFKGFVGDTRNNTGEDRGYKIDTGGALLERYNVASGGQVYPIVVTCSDREIGRVMVKIIEPRTSSMK